jgi:hypothetical protein
MAKVAKVMVNIMVKITVIKYWSMSDVAGTCGITVEQAPVVIISKFIAFRPKSGQNNLSRT